jgi:Uma2 family endonuclease
MSTSKPVLPETIPFLEPGDRLTREEFERRYEAMKHVKKAELIEGVVYMPSPVRLSQHAAPHSHMIGWMYYYKAYTPCVIVADNATARLDLDNEPQPDGMLLLDPSCGGHAAISADDYVEAAPELVVEVSASSASYDLHTKRTVYRRNGVCEYLVWRVLDRQIDWFVARGSTFEPLTPDITGILRSEVFPGLWLDAAAMLGGDAAAVLATLQQGLTSPEHATFLQKHAKTG